jgi:hypothetical protein
MFPGCGKTFSSIGSYIYKIKAGQFEQSPKRVLLHKQTFAMAQT